MCPGQQQQQRQTCLLSEERVRSALKFHRAQPYPGCLVETNLDDLGLEKGMKLVAGGGLVSRGAKHATGFVASALGNPDPVVAPSPAPAGWRRPGLVGVRRMSEPRAIVHVQGSTD
jgi:hypothetical protein